MQHGIHPRDHGFVSGAETTASSTGRGMLKGAGWGFLVGALIVGGLVATGGLAFIGYMGAGTAAVFGAGGSLATWGGTVAAATAVASVVGGILSISLGSGLGGVVGFFKGLSRVGRERSAHDEMQMNAELAYAHGIQQGRGAGQQEVMNALAAQHAGTPTPSVSEGNVVPFQQAKFAEQARNKPASTSGSKTELIEAQRAAQAAHQQTAQGAAIA